jgi:hypothetical protein
LEDFPVGVGGSVALELDSAIISTSLPVSDVRGEEPRELMVAVTASSRRRRAGEMGGCVVK